MHAGATNIKLNTAKSLSWREKDPSSIIQKVKPLKRAAKIWRAILFQM